MAEVHLLSPRGFRAGAIHAGIKTRQAPDVALLVCEVSAAAAAVFTSNRVAAAPVEIGRRHVASGRLRGVVVNAGNANACTGRRGLGDAIRMCQLAARLVGCDAHEILPGSTGIIGHPLPMDKIAEGIAGAYEFLGDSEEHALRFGDAILTTDTKRKQAAAVVKLGREKITIAGACKGSGMIAPRMALDGSKPVSARAKKAAAHATMLAYLTTDARVPAPILRKLLAEATERSFNSVTVDDHTSTNDTAAILASGLAGGTIRSAGEMRKFAKALDEVCQSLAYQIAADGEGATKVVRIDVRGAANDSAGRTIARAIANSPLVKCAMNGNDPNWGRIISAAGMCGVPFDPNKAVLRLQGTTVFRRGQPAPFDAPGLSKSLAAAEVRVELLCNLGQGNATCWTCDLSMEYVTINAEYHT